MNLAIVIPAFNEELLIGRAIWSVRRAGVCAKDIYVVDDGSTDATAKIASRYSCQVLMVANQGKAKAIYAGIRCFQLLERYEWVGILDADSELDPNYVVEMAKYPKQGIGLLCGSPRSRQSNWLTAYRAVEYAINLGIYREAQALYHAITVAPGCASVYHVGTLRQLDFNGGTLTEDMDLTLQVHDLGIAIAYVPKALVYTQDPATLRDYVGQVNRWYRGAWQNVRKHRIGLHARMVDVELVMLLLEGFIFSGILVVGLLLLPWLLYRHLYACGMVFAVDQLLLLGYACLVARREQRWDVLWGFPLFQIPRVLNSCVFLHAFVSECRHNPITWFTVQRRIK